MKKTPKDALLQDIGKAALRQELSGQNPAGAPHPVTVSQKMIQNRLITGPQDIPGRSIPMPGQKMITKAVKPKNRTTTATTIPVQIVLYGQIIQKNTIAEAVTTDVQKHGAISRHREANHRLLLAALTTAAIAGAVQARPTRAAVLRDQEAVAPAEAVAPVVEAQPAVVDDNRVSASSFPNNNARVSLCGETRIFKIPQR